MVKKLVKRYFCNKCGYVYTSLKGWKAHVDEVEINSGYKHNDGYSIFVVEQDELK